jgi:hypothetical protein
VRSSEAPAARADLRAIEDALRSAQHHLADDAAHDTMGEPVVENMLAGYARVDELVAARVDLLAMGQVEHLLELNRLVLCGADPERRARYAEHLAASERRFYEEPAAGIGDLLEALKLERPDDVWERAAAAYAGMASEPQLFIEGNHRTGALLISAVLMQAGEPPFVLDASNAQAYFEASAALRGVRKHSFGAMFQLGGLRRRLAELLRRARREEYLRHE